MHLVERALCLLGRHEWHVAESEAGRVDADWFKRVGTDPASCWKAGCCAPAVVLTLIGGLSSVSSLLSQSSSALVFVSILVVGLIWGWTASFLDRYKDWEDALCHRCGKHRLDLTRRRQKVESAKLLFDAMREVNGDTTMPKQQKKNKA